MKYFYIEYTEYFENDYDESESTIIEAKNKKEAIKILKNRTLENEHLKIEIDTMYETSSDARL